MCRRPHHDRGFLAGRLERTPWISWKIWRVRFRRASLEVEVKVWRPVEVSEEFEMEGRGPGPLLWFGGFIVGSMGLLRGVGLRWIS